MVNVTDISPYLRPQADYSPSDCDTQAVVGAHADYRPEDYRFARQQSYAMREAAMERSSAENFARFWRAWGRDILAGALLTAFFAFCFIGLPMMIGG